MKKAIYKKDIKAMIKKFNLDEFTLFNAILEGEHLTIRNGSNCHVTHCSLLVGFWGRFPSPMN